MAKKSSKSVNKKLIGLTIFGFLICCLAIAVIIIYWPQNTLEEPVKIRIKKGSTLTQISKILADSGIVSNQDMFITSAKMMGHSNKIPAGSFVLVDVKSNHALINQLIHGEQQVKKVTLLEGWSIPQVAQAISNALNINSEIFTNFCYNSQFIQELGLEAPSLEGYLCPDTYLFLESEDEPRAIIKRIIEQFQIVYDEKLIERTEQLGFSINEVLTLASIIEGEAIFDSEKPIISGVYNNRLKRGMLLQADPTIQYIIPDGPRRLRYSDLKIDSPYNTYLYKGLPPAPINSPGKASILAALYPEENDFLFFVARGDGYHTFTRTTEEHNLAKLQFQEIRKRVAENN